MNESYCADITRFIALPSSNPRLLIPIASRRSQTLSFDLYSPGSLYGKLFKQLGRFAAQSGLLAIAGRFLSKPIYDADVAEAIRPVLSEDNITTLKLEWEKLLREKHLCFAMSLGTPNAYQKVTALLLDQKARPLAIAKIGAAPESKKLIANECSALRKLKKVEFKNAQIPELLGSGKNDQVDWLLQSALLKGMQSANVIENAHISFLSELAHHTSRSMPLIESAFWKRWCSVFDKQLTQATIENVSEFPFITRLAEVFQQQAADKLHKPWPFTTAHGDFAPWNMRVLNDGRIALFDWEYFLQDAPAGWDILYFLFRVDNLIKKKTLEQIWAEFQTGAYWSMLDRWEEATGLNVPDKMFLGMIMLLSMGLNLFPELIETC